MTDDRPYSFWSEVKKMSNSKLEIISEIRRLGKSNRGKDLGLLQLSDDCLYQIYLQLKAGVSNRSIARMLQTRYGVARSENAIQQGVSLLRKRIAILLESPKTGLPFTPITVPSGLSDMPIDDAVDTLDSIVAAYGNSIKQMFEAAECSDGMLTEDISKHVKAYTALVAAKTRLQRSAKRISANEYINDAEFERRSKLVLEKYVGDDGQKMIKSADKLLKVLETRCVTMELDPETGQYETV
jgi:hypothetical protein